MTNWRVNWLYLGLAVKVSSLPVILYATFTRALSLQSHILRLHFIFHLFRDLNTDRYFYAVRHAGNITHSGIDEVDKTNDAFTPRHSVHTARISGRLKTRDPTTRHQIKQR